MAISPYAAGRRSPRCRRPSTSPRTTCRTASRTAGRAWSRSGPSRSRGIRSASEPATAYRTAAVASTPTSPSTPRAFQPSRAPLPTATPVTTASVPAVGVSAFAVISSSGRTTCGSDADRPASRNRFTDRQARISTNSAGPRRSALAATASTVTSPARAKFAQASTCRRDQRSRNTPTNGPSRLNGSSTTASAAAISPAPGARSGENTTYDASATWNTPSVSWLVIRTANSRRNHVPRSRCTRCRSAVTRPSSRAEAVDR